jgi:hypothetical protein
MGVALSRFTAHATLDQLAALVGGHRGVVMLIGLRAASPKMCAYLGAPPASPRAICGHLRAPSEGSMRLPPSPVRAADRLAQN